MARRAAGIDVEYGIEACFGEMAVQIEPLARHVDSLPSRDITQRVFGNSHRVSQ